MSGYAALTQPPTWITAEFSHALRKIIRAYTKTRHTNTGLAGDRTPLKRKKAAAFVRNLLL
jgi:hypothetical protein